MLAQMFKVTVCLLFGWYAFILWVLEYDKHRGREAPSYMYIMCAFALFLLPFCLMFG